MRNAIRFLKEANVDAIKLEGGVRTVSRVKAILDAGVAVCGHIGLTPQSSGQLGGHKAQGRTLESAKLVVEDARALYEAGVQLLLVEAVPPEVAGFIRAELPIPVLGIGAGEDVDGQLLIVSDVLGTFAAFTPKFVKKYADLAASRPPRSREYVTDVRGGAFPEEQHCYRMLEGEQDRFARGPTRRAEARTPEGRVMHSLAEDLTAARLAASCRPTGSRGSGPRRCSPSRPRRPRSPPRGGRSTRSTWATSTSRPRSPSSRR